MTDAKHLTTEELEAGLEEILRAPRQQGVLQRIVRRPTVGEREELSEGTLDPVVGLVGDSWNARGSSRTEDGSAHPDMQLTLMGCRAIALVAQTEERWPLAGDQLFVDMDLSAESVPPATRLGLGSAVIEVTDQPHTGCKKFAHRFGTDALRFVNSARGRELNLRGINARVVQGGTIRPGDAVKRLS